MPPKSKRFVVPMRGRTEEAEVGAFADAFAHFLGYLAANGTRVERGTICVPVMGNLDGTLSRLLGERRTARLIRGENIRFKEGFQIQARSTRTIHKFPQPEVVLAVFADRKMLKVLDEMPGVEALFVVPWDWDEVHDWVEKREAKILDED